MHLQASEPHSTPGLSMHESSVLENSGTGVNPVVLDVPYLLVSHIPTYPGPDDRRLVDELWHRDLVGHLPYLSHFLMAAPLESGPLPARALPLPERGITYIDLASKRGTLRSWLGLPLDVVRLWRAIGRAAIVHIGVVGWPYAPGWIAAPLAKLRRRSLVIVIESSPWRITPADRQRAGARQRLRAAVWEALARWCVGLADVAFFTQAGYRDSLLPPGRVGHILPASWIDERGVLTDREAEALWDERLAPSEGRLRVAFVGRLEAAKGLPTLLEALGQLDREGVRVDLDIFGAGPLEAECARAAAAMGGSATIRLRGTLAYGDAFFAALRPYQAIAVPSLGEEQPRILYDAFSQALPILGSDTTGIREVVTPGLDGRLAPPGDAAALATLLRQAAAEPGWLRPAGLAGLLKARGLTHQEMHRRRARILLASCRVAGSSPAAAVAPPETQP